MAMSGQSGVVRRNGVDVEPEEEEEIVMVVVKESASRLPACMRIRQTNGMGREQRQRKAHLTSPHPTNPQRHIHK